jgi:hypothetical protein
MNDIYKIKIKTGIFYKTYKICGFTYIQNAIELHLPYDKGVVVIPLSRIKQMSLGSDFILATRAKIQKESGN